MECSRDDTENQHDKGLGRDQGRFDRHLGSYSRNKDKKCYLFLTCVEFTPLHKSPMEALYEI